MKKGQSQIVSALIIVLIGLSILGTVFPWAVSIIQKKKDAKSVDDVYNFFKKLDSTIVDRARNGGEESLELKVPGKITVYPESYSGALNNSIVFMFESKVSNIANSTTWIPLNTPNLNETGILGIDKSAVIFGKSTLGDNEITVQYKLWFRELEDETTRNIYKISITTSDDTEKQSTQGFFRVQRLSSNKVGNLIKTQINIIV